MDTEVGNQTRLAEGKTKNGGEGGILNTWSSSLGKTLSTRLYSLPSQGIMTHRR